MDIQEFGEGDDAVEVHIPLLHPCLQKQTYEEDSDGPFVIQPREQCISAHFMNTFCC